MKKKYLILILILSLIIPSFVKASTNTYERTNENLRLPDKVEYKTSMYNNIINTPAVDSSEKIYDFADIFTNQEEQELYNETKSFMHNTNLDLAIVTIDYNPKESTREYADDFYDYNDFDINGLVYVIDMYDREFYISTSGTALLYYDDIRIENTLTSMDNSMYNARYKESATIMINHLTSYHKQGYSSTNNKYTIDNGLVVYKTPYLTLIIISFVVATIITLILAKRNKPVKLSKDSNLYLSKNNVKITNSQTNYINSHTTSVYIPPSSSSGGSSKGGFHSGSSGISHGGGGHRF